MKLLRVFTLRQFNCCCKITERCGKYGTYRIGKKTYSRSRRISHFDGLNFDCATNSDTFNCTNNFFDPYLPIHHTTFMALQFVLRPFTLRFPNFPIPIPSS